MTTDSFVRLTEQFIKNGRIDLVNSMITQELKKLRAIERRRVEQTRKTNQNVDVDTLNFLYGEKYGNLIEQIKELTDIRAELKKSDTQGIAMRDLVDFNKRRELQKTKQINLPSVVSMYVSVTDDKIQETFDRMFNKGNYLLTPSEMRKYDQLFDKYGIGISMSIKNKIKNQYKHWTSDIAYTFISEWSDKALELSKSDEVSAEDMQNFKKYIAEIKGRLP